MELFSKPCDHGNKTAVRAGKTSSAVPHTSGLTLEFVPKHWEAAGYPFEVSSFCLLSSDDAGKVLQDQNDFTLQARCVVTNPGFSH